MGISTIKNFIKSTAWKKGFLALVFVLIVLFGGTNTAEARTYSSSVLDHVESFIKDLDYSGPLNDTDAVTSAEWTQLKETAQDASDAFDTMINSGWLEVDMNGVGTDEAGDDNWDDGIANIKILDPRGGPLLQAYLEKMRTMYQAEVDVINRLPGAEDDQDDAVKNLNSISNILAKTDFTGLETGQTLHDDDQANGGYDLAITNSDGSSDVIEASDSGGPVECGITSGEKLMGCVAWATYNIVLKGSSLVLFLVGMIFNMTLSFTLNIGELFLPNSGIGLGGATGSIYLGWSTVRNFINIIFIFVLLYVAISTIVQNDSYGWKKMIPKIVIAAMFINFSLFFTKAIIDLSNILALQFYARILEAAKTVGGDPSEADGGLSIAILNASGLSTVWTTKSANGALVQNNPRDISMDQFARAAGLDAYKIITISLFGGLFIFLLAGVLFVGIARFLARTIILLFLMVTSPFGFVGEAIPALGGIAKKWRERLTNNAIFAPAYMAVLYVICQIMFGEAQGSLTAGGGFRALLVGTPEQKVNAIGIGFWFFLICGLLLTGIAAANKFADEFGKGFVSATDNFYKGKGKFGWRRPGGWAAGKARDGAKAGGRAGLSLLSRATGLETQKKRDERLAQNLKDAKLKADNLRQKSGESKEQFEVRQAAVVNKAKTAQARAQGLNTAVDHRSPADQQPGHFNVTFIKDATGNIIGHKLGDLNDAGKAEIKTQKQEAKKKFTQRRRKAAADSLKRTEEAFAAPKAGSSDALEKEKDAASTKLEAMLDKKTVQSQAYVKTKEDLYTKMDNLQKTHDTQVVKYGRTSKTTIDNLKAAKKAYFEHVEEENKLQKQVHELKEKWQKAKDTEADKQEKQKEKEDAKKNKK